VSDIDRAAIARLRKRIRRQVAGFGGNDKRTDRALMTWIMFAVRAWAEAEAPKRARGRGRGAP
jgi:hypothetical protein